MIKIIFVRHAQAKSNTKSKICFNGTIDEHLTSIGISQAERCAKALKDIKIDIIFSSTLRRAIETAEIINKYHNAKVILDKRLNEANFGIWEGLTMREVIEKYPKMYQERLKDKYHYRIKEGESYQDIEKRIARFLANINVKYNNKNILIVTHATTLKLIFKHLLKLNLKLIEKEYYKNTCISIIGIGKEIKIEKFNDSSHLD